MNTSFPIGLKRAAAMVVLRAQRQFLLLKRAKPPNQGLFVPVGGKLDPHEDPYSAALRETLEETGLTIDRLQYGGVLVETSPVDYNWWCSIYLADIPYQPAPDCDEGELHWISFEALETLPTPPTDWHIYQFLEAERPFALNAVYDEQLQLIYLQEEISGEVLVGRR